jgi:hypothetical protein
MKELESQTVRNYINCFFPILTNLPPYVWKNMESANKQTIIHKNYKIIYVLISTKDKQANEWYMNLLNCYEWRKCYQDIKNDADAEFNRLLVGSFLAETVLAEMKNRNKLF